MNRSPAPGPGILGTGGVAAIIAAVCYSSFLLSPWTHATATARSGFISELEDPGQPFAWLYRGSDLAAGVGLLVAAWAVHRLTAGCRWSVPGVILLALTGLGSILGAATSMQCDPGTSARCANDEHTAAGLIGQLLALHTDSGLLEFAGSAAGAAVLGATLAGRWRVWGRLQITLGITLASCGLVDLLLLLLGDSIGTAERVRVVLTSGWFVLIGLFLLRAAFLADAPRLTEKPPGSRGGPERRPA